MAGTAGVLMSFLMSGRSLPSVACRFFSSSSNVDTSKIGRELFNTAIYLAFRIHINITLIMSTKNAAVQDEVSVLPKDFAKCFERF